MVDWPRLGGRVASDLLRWAPKGTFSHGVGWMSRRRVPRPLREVLYKGFARYAGADLSVVDRPLDAFERFDDFFTRPLVEGARPIATGEGVVVSPCDGVVSEVGISDGGRLVQCKGLDYTVRGLLGDAPEASRFEGGAYATIYLAPRDYHRVHSPVQGRVVASRHLPGTLFPVNAVSVQNVVGLFSINERLVTLLETSLGQVAVVMVAATGVGHITVRYDPTVATHRGREVQVRTYDAPHPLERGEELGTFHLGSTVILLFERDRARLSCGRGENLLMGARIGEQSVASKAFAS